MLNKFRYFVNVFNGCKYMCNNPKIIANFKFNQAYKEISKEEYEVLPDIF